MSYSQIDKVIKLNTPIMYDLQTVNISNISRSMPLIITLDESLNEFRRNQAQLLFIIDFVED